ncbi:MAG: gamma carbonic anhydrase family protein [Verrucomicrobiales bacterium]|nr:gamma carbonic anhydrase family protein [Verrucomicrobiales bacterium]
MICTHLHKNPHYGTNVFIAPGAVITGDVSLGDNVSVWYQSVLRADIEKIVIGNGSNIQDGTVIHMSSDTGTVVGEYVTVGHKALLHACLIGNESLIGMGAIVMDGAEIGSQCIVGAGSLVTRGTIVPDGSLVIGSPAKIIKPLDADERKAIRHWAEKYIQVAEEHRAHLEQASGSSER